MFVVARLPGHESSVTDKNGLEAVRRRPGDQAEKGVN